jgi:hypothetical protein
MLEDYKLDCIGFFKRNPQILIRVLDDYNCDITDRCLLAGDVVPPQISASKLESAIRLLAMRPPVEILYAIRSQETFSFAGTNLRSQEFNSLPIENLIYNIITDLWDAYTSDQIVYDLITNSAQHIFG